MPVSVLHTLSYSSCCLTLSGQPAKVLFLLLLLTVVRSLCYTIYPQPYITSQRKKTLSTHSSPFFPLLQSPFSQDPAVKVRTKPSVLRPLVRPASLASPPLFLHPFPPCSLSVCPFLSVLSVSFSSDASPRKRPYRKRGEKEGASFSISLPPPTQPANIVQYTSNQPPLLSFHDSPHPARYF